MYRPNFKQMSTPIMFHKRVEVSIKGVDDVSYTEYPTDSVAFCQFKGKGGTESEKDGTPVVTDTAEVIMWYRDDVTVKDRIQLLDQTDVFYEIVNVENIEMRNQFLMMKVKRVVTA